MAKYILLAVAFFLLILGLLCDAGNLVTSRRDASGQKSRFSPVVLIPALLYLASLWLFDFALRLGGVHFPVYWAFPPLALWHLFAMSRFGFSGNGKRGDR